MYTSDIHYVARGTVISKDIDEVNKRAAYVNRGRGMEDREERSEGLFIGPNVKVQRY
jgi:hypothetical protein